MSGTETLTQVTFAAKDSARFADEMKRRVAEYFEQRNLSQHANFAMVFKTVLILAVTAGGIALIFTGWFTPWQMLGLCVVTGLGMAGIGFCIAHDALHGGYSASPRVNKILGLCFDLIGANGYMWQLTHNGIHHTYTNIHGIDEDLTVSPLLRLTPEAEHKFIHRFQHLYFVIAYSFSTLYWIFAKDYKYFLQKDLGPYKNKKHPKSEIASMLFMKLFYYGWAIALPLAVLPVTWWQFAIGFCTMHLTAGVVLGVVFQLAHVVEGPDHPMPDGEGMMESAWFIHQMQTTANFATHNPFVNWYVGGLNFQIEHHLFPKICSVHYPAISPIVKEVAEKHGVPYHVNRTFFGAVASHYRMLKHLGKGERTVLKPAAA